MSTPTLYAVTVLGHDRPGIIAETTGQLAGLGLNLEDSTMTLLRGHFAMMLVCSGDVEAADIESALAPLTADGTLTVTVREVPEESAPAAAGTSWVLTVHGGDRPGIVSGVVAEVAARRRQHHRPQHPALGQPLPAGRRVRRARRHRRRRPRDRDPYGGHRPRCRRHPASRGGRRAVSDTPTPAGTSERLAAWTEDELGVEGRVLEVVRVPDPVLSTPGEDVDPTSAEIVQLAADLVATMRVSPGCVGLAAPQVGVAARVFCVDVSAHPKTRDHHGTFVLCNAEVVESSRNEKAREGCMSVPDLTGDVKRASRLVVRGQLPGTGEEVTFATNAFEARCLQHEIDHCAGLRLPRPGRRRARDPPAQDLPVVPGGAVATGAAALLAPVSQSAEEVALKAAKCGFESHRGHMSEEHRTAGALSSGTAIRRVAPDLVGPAEPPPGRARRPPGARAALDVGCGEGADVVCWPGRLAGHRRRRVRVADALERRASTRRVRDAESVHWRPRDLLAARRFGVRQLASVVLGDSELARHLRSLTPALAASMCPCDRS